MIDNREAILSGLRETGRFGSKAEALSDDNFLSATLLINNHLHALEPNTLLILGGRGAGKSHLFRLVNLPSAQKIISKNKQRIANAIWLKGFYTQASQIQNNPLYFPGDTVLQRFSKNKTTTDLLDFWRGLLLGAILKQVNKDEDILTLLQTYLPNSLLETLDNLEEPNKWHKEVVENIETVEATLNKLDQVLSNHNRYLFATYDDLDVMAVEWSEKRILIQSLLRFWLGQWRRWRRIRPKVFLRFDLFAPDFLQFPDASKLGGNKIELRWQFTQLYQLAFKSWANRNQASLNFLQQANLNLIKDDLQGWTYSKPLPTEDQLRNVVHKIMGQFMGSGPTKGRTFNWIPNHLQDTNGEIVPRSMLNLLSLAAQDELDHNRAKPPLLLSPLSVRYVIESVSEDRVRELTEEYTWLEVLKPYLAEQQVPLTRNKFTRLINGIDWEDQPSRPVNLKPSNIVDNLLDIGILRLTTDKRIHVPDIYLYGFNMKRKGGIRRPK